MNATINAAHTAPTTLSLIFLKKLSRSGAIIYTIATPPSPNTKRPSAHILPLRLRKYPL
jgi:hypothetical protein